MISKTQIRYMANSSSYSKGAELYATGKVLDMDVKNALIMRYYLGFLTV